MLEELLELLELDELELEEELMLEELLELLLDELLELELEELLEELDSLEDELEEESLLDEVLLEEESLVEDGLRVGFCHRVLIKSGPGNRVFWHAAPPTRLCLEFRRETGLILMCTRKVGNAFQTKQGNRTSCRDQEGRRVSDEVVPGSSVFSSSETGMSGNFWGRIKGSK